MMRVKTFLRVLALIGAALPAAAPAQAPAGAALQGATPVASAAAAAHERQRLASARAAAETHYAQRQRECAVRFVVTACVEDAKRERRTNLLRLKRELQELDDSLRRQRAAERTEAIRRRAAEEAQPRREALLRPSREKADRPGGDRPSPRRDDATTSDGEPSTRRSNGAARDRREPTQAVRAKPTPPPAAGARTELESRSRATFDAAQRAAEAHRSEVEARQARRSATRKMSNPLPVPAGASAP